MKHGEIATQEPGSRSFAHRLGLTLALLGLLYILWQLADALLILFGAVLLAILLNGTARRMAAPLALPRRLALAILLFALLAAFGAAGWFGWPMLADQFGQLFEQLPKFLENIRQDLREYQWGRALVDHSPSLAQALPGTGTFLWRLTGIASTGLSVLTSIALIIIVGIYLAAQPELHLKGLLYLVPPRRKARAREVTGTIEHALWLWLLGQLVGMVIIGTLTTAGLLLLGIPFAVPLGLLAGALEFIPYIGPILAMTPALLVAFGEGPTAALYVLALYFAIQQGEAYLVMPLVQREAVSLPPAVAIMATLVFGLLFGPLGVVFATPLAVFLMVLVTMLYVQDGLGVEVRALGQ